MGKSASRFPFITLLMSFGTESVTTNKVGEQIYVFKRKKKKVRTGTTTISMDSGNRTLPNCYTPSYLYTYDVYSHMKPEPVEPDAKKENEKAYNAQAASLPCGPLSILPPSVGGQSDGNLEAQRTLEVDMNILQESTVANETRILPKGAMIKENSVLAKGSSLCTLAVVNRLENTKWHVVDDLTFCADSKLESDSSYVLFTSPKVPKYTPQEQAALLNTIEHEPSLQRMSTKLLRSPTLSFIPRFVLNPKRTKKAIAKLWKSPNELTEIEPKLLFSDKEYIKTLESMSPSAEFNQQRERFFMQAFNCKEADCEPIPAGAPNQRHWSQFDVSVACPTVRSHPAVEKFRLKGDYTAASFIPRENVWVMDGHARKLKEVTLARTGRLILSSAAALEPNTNPAHFRCYFCDRIFTEFFPSHYCQNVAQKYEEALETNEQEMLPEDEGIFLEQSSLTGRERRNDFDPSFEFNLISTRPLDLGVGSNEKWRELKGIKLTYPHPSKPIPKSSVSLEALCCWAQDRFSPFEIRGTSLVDTKRRKDRPAKIVELIDNGQALTKADSKHILSDKRALSLLPESDLILKLESRL
ncbi:hypothetical protein BLNAU_20900 [Blattamonas nauphoetae]|uniref:Uncharacterized protein n=1 Tax=Blattamonas nauphoetae TaxID=2049346 RepID=A0ABQ9WXF2_9EUKA|nr:hypothetical protein BLNAU_20900 [Blattamonas nauphoetae]